MFGRSLSQAWRPKTTADWVILLLRCGLGTLWVYAALTKWHEGPDAFVRTLQQQENFWLPAAWLPTAAVVLMGLELVVGISLLSGLATAELSFVSMVLFGLFSVFVLRALQHHSPASCGCFGTSSTPPTWGTWLLHDALPEIASLLLFVLCLQRERRRSV